MSLPPISWKAISRGDLASELGSDVGQLLWKGKEKFWLVAVRGGFIFNNVPSTMTSPRRDIMLLASCGHALAFVKTLWIFYHRVSCEGYSVSGDASDTMKSIPVTSLYCSKCEELPEHSSKPSPDSQVRPGNPCSSFHPCPSTRKIFPKLFFFFLLLFLLENCIQVPLLWGLPQMADR